MRFQPTITDAIVNRPITVLSVVLRHQNGIFFIDGPGLSFFTRKAAALE